MKKKSHNREVQDVSEKGANKGLVIEQIEEQTRYCTAPIESEDTVTAYIQQVINGIARLSLSIIWRVCPLSVNHGVTNQNMEKIRGVEILKRK